MFQAERKQRLGAASAHAPQRASREHHVLRRDPPSGSSRGCWEIQPGRRLSQPRSQPRKHRQAALTRSRGAQVPGPGRRPRPPARPLRPRLNFPSPSPPRGRRVTHGAATLRGVGGKPRNDWASYSRKRTGDFIMGKTARLAQGLGEKGSPSWQLFEHWAIYTDGTGGPEVRTHHIVILPIIAHFRTLQWSFVNYGNVLRKNGLVPL